jgi:hypothetical protein
VTEQQSGAPYRVIGTGVTILGIESMTRATQLALERANEERQPMAVNDCDDRLIATIMPAHRRPGETW